MDDPRQAGSLDDLGARLEHAVIAIPVACRGCGYDLRGQGTAGVCPECGLAVLESVRALVDPAASGLPRLRDPRGVGNALLWLMLCGLLAASALVATPVMAWIAGGRLEIDAGALSLPRDLPLVSAAAILLGVWSLVKLKPPRGREPETAVRRDLWLLAVAVPLWATMGVLLWLTPAPPGVANGGWTDPARIRILLGFVAAGAIALLGLGGVLRTIGRRSRAYRQSHAARQGIVAMLGALVGIALGQTLLGLTGGAPGPPPWHFGIGRTLVVMCAFMALVGLLYLLVNAWWIRGALHRPPPRLEDVVTTGR